jgi:hypothetical protein
LERRTFEQPSVIPFTGSSEHTRAPRSDPDQRWWPRWKYDDTPKGVMYLGDARQEVPLVDTAQVDESGQAAAHEPRRPSTQCQPCRTVVRIATNPPRRRLITPTEAPNQLGRARYRPRRVRRHSSPACHRTYASRHDHNHGTIVLQHQAPGDRPRQPVQHFRRPANDHDRPARTAAQCRPRGREA